MLLLIFSICCYSDNFTLDVLHLFSYADVDYDMCIIRADSREGLNPTDGRATWKRFVNGDIWQTDMPYSHRSHQVPVDFNIRSPNLRPIETTFTYLLVGRLGTPGPPPQPRPRFLVCLCYLPPHDRHPIRNQPTRLNHPLCTPSSAIPDFQ